MEPTKEQIEKLKHLELEMLQIFIDICDRLNLHYYVIGGTLIGAIRHHGFIPWDDDVDVAMFREDFEEFLRKAPALLPEHLFLQSIWSDAGYLQCFAKIRNSETTFIEKPVAHRKMNHGVFIDIFPLDLYPEAMAARKRFKKKNKVYDRRITSLLIPERPLRLKNKMVSLLLRLRYPSYRKVLYKLDRLYQSIEKSSLCNKTGGYRNDVVPVAWYGDGVKVQFEGLEVNAPQEYDKLLTQTYGDYMALPPEDEQLGHHFTEIFDLEKPYTEYIK